MQSTWKPWPHCGSTRNSSPAANSTRQMAQSVNFAAASSAGEKVCLGRARRTFFFTPLLACEELGAPGGALPPPAAAAGPEEERRRIQAQRATATRPRTQIRAQRSAASMTTKSLSTGGTGGWESPAGAVVAAAGTESSSLNGRVMWRSCREREREREELGILELGILGVH
ncbi:unnamed protein product [Linum tenue]|uniref:Uncharacterized protein n=1 Tax=Linum tenue TaxID=586396 RepID=A0AAV0LMP9_9ROSI|nr:unnamed protein product [Linum tenue]